MMLLKASTSKGQQIVSRARYNRGTHLSDVYGRWSARKESAYNWCREKYESTEEHSDFHICSANTNFFSVAWEGMHEGQPAVFMETASNSFVVLLEQ